MRVDSGGGVVDADGESEGIGQQCRQCLLGWVTARGSLCIGVPGVGMNVPTASVSCALLRRMYLASYPHLTQFRI